VLVIRAHSKFSASGAERWMKCPGSVALSEGIPDKPNRYTVEGERAHTLLESLLEAGKLGLERHLSTSIFSDGSSPPKEMWEHCKRTRDFILDRWKKRPGSDLLVETRVYLKFIHPEMFGTFDSMIVDHFETLDVIDFKYGAGVAVSPRKNFQMLFYGIGAAFLHQWNFKRVRLWIDQPRIRGYDGPVFWETPIMALRPWVDVFKRAVERVEREPNTFVEGTWCWWCKAKGVCPLKTEKKADRAREIFRMSP
jgi:Protein of unknown function (DUF2800)